MAVAVFVIGCFCLLSVTSFGELSLVCVAWL